MNNQGMIVNIEVAEDWIWAKGRIDPGLFAAHCRDHDDGYEVRPEDVRNGYFRNIPSPPDDDYLYRLYPSKPGRGAYEITYSEHFYSLDLPVDRERSAVEEYLAKQESTGNPE